MSWTNFFIPQCLQPSEVVKVTNLATCLSGGSTGGIIGYVTQTIFVIAAVISFVYLLYGAFMMLTAFGNEQKFTQAKQTILYALIGFAVASLASLIVGAFIDFLSRPFAG
jgi:uncharacterized membrane protein